MVVMELFFNVPREISPDSFSTFIDLMIVCRESPVSFSSSEMDKSVIPVFLSADSSNARKTTST